ncbi:ATP-binding protein [Telmatospirillum siberiense]|uniref:histidine kinase n=1 Tax=Telmatospirillum siberiense TaxID=382514 RepID=A0A2N3PZU1_9PROT|nr:ATP-binding protein [Telmatospirillum siberiense]PKU25916.1 hybrid sensor histidine kinase/response regulator [Telmatospirillum siberiense]
MAIQQRIVRTRRIYNQWVANQTLEDFALRFTAKRARRWSSSRVANTALGAISFLALEAIGGTVTLSYGFPNAVAAILAVSAIIFLTCVPISYYAVKYGVDIDLLTRGAGFGYIGSTITSLVYASFTFIFFAIEAVIMSTALETCFGIPLSVGYLLCSLIVIPLVTHGITFISRFQLWTHPLWMGLHIAPFLFIALNSQDSFRSWTGFSGRAGVAGGDFDPLLFGAATTVVFSLIAQIGEQVDFLRFMPQNRKTSPTGWWVALLSGGPGWILPGLVKLLAGSFLAVLAIGHGVPVEQAGEPTHMYQVAFLNIVPSPAAAIALTGFFVIVSQLKINVTNAYAGSIAWSNFFSRLTHRHPGRVIWLVFNVVIALLLMELGIYQALEHILGLYSSIAASWVGALVADLVINKPLRLSPPHIEFKRAHLYDINPVGVGAMALAVLTSVAAFLGLLGPLAHAFTALIAFLTAFTTAPLIALATKGRYYIARKARRNWRDATEIVCCICENSFEPEDMAHCPAYSGPICSLCCSLDSRCNDLCKPTARLSHQILALLRSFLPEPIVSRLHSPLGHYLGVLAMLLGLIAFILTIIYTQSTFGAEELKPIIKIAFEKTFVIVGIIAAIVSWLYVLAQESRRTAQMETRRQTDLLIKEIQAHNHTDAQLQKAKEVAEAANLAKSRYVVGMTHELRTPLNAILGYAQLLERDSTIPPHRRDAIAVIRRSGDHLSGLIEGLLDISKIEAGRLRLRRDEVRLAAFLEQIIDMFRLQASVKGLDFIFQPIDHLPSMVHTDEARLRQILINLLSNAIKFTRDGHVAVRFRYRSQVAEFDVEDTGVGIQPGDIARVFEPFERVETPGLEPVPGIGLGLTITKLLTEVMGGEISVSSRVGKGTVFRVKMLLSEVQNPSPTLAAQATAIGYLGRRRSVMVVDNDASHRALIEDLLIPLGFDLESVPDGVSCLDRAETSRPDLFLLDVSMPGLNGWDLCRRLRETGHEEAAIIMISANALDLPQGSETRIWHDDYLMKPFNIRDLLDRIGQRLNLEWTRDPAEVAQQNQPAPTFTARDVPAPHHLNDLYRLGQIGYVRGIQTKLDEIERESSDHEQFVTHLRGLVRNFELGHYMTAIESLYGEIHG